MRTTKKRGFFGVVIDPQSYLNIIYLLLAFPLGTFYFVFLVTGLSVGLGMIITLLGIPIMLLVLVISRALCAFERKVTISLLNEDISSYSIQPTSGGLWSKFKVLMTSRNTWIGLFYLLLKFPLGTATFSIAVTLVSISVSLISAPAWAWTVDTETWGGWTFDPFTWSPLFVLIGIIFVFISLHLMNIIAIASGRLTRLMLGR